LDILRTWLDRPEPAPEPCAEGEGEGEGEGGATAAQQNQNQNQVDDAVFFSSYIPRSLGEVYDPERDVDLLKSGQGDTLIYASLTGLDIHDNKAAIEEPEVEAVEPEVELAGKSKGKKGKGKKAKADVAENQADKPVIGEVSAEATTEPHEAAPTTQAPAEAPDAPAPAPTTPPPSLAPMPRSALAGTSPKKGMGVRWEDEEPAAEGDEEDDEEDDEEGEGEYERRSRGFRHVDKEDKKVSPERRGGGARRRGVERRRGSGVDGGCGEEGETTGRDNADFTLGPQKGAQGGNARKAENQNAKGDKGAVDQEEQWKVSLSLRSELAE
jgi:hypothetical protein